MSLGKHGLEGDKGMYHCPSRNGHENEVKDSMVEGAPGSGHTSSWQLHQVASHGCSSGPSVQQSKGRINQAQGSVVRFFHLPVYVQQS